MQAVKGAAIGFAPKVRIIRELLQCARAAWVRAPGTRRSLARPVLRLHGCRVTVARIVSDMTAGIRHLSWHRAAAGFAPLAPSPLCADNEHYVKWKQEGFLRRTWHTITCPSPVDLIHLPSS